MEGWFSQADLRRLRASRPASPQPSGKESTLIPCCRYLLVPSFSRALGGLSTPGFRARRPSHGVPFFHGHDAVPLRSQAEREFDLGTGPPPRPVLRPAAVHVSRQSSLRQSPPPEPKSCHGTMTPQRTTWNHLEPPGTSRRRHIGRPRTQVRRTRDWRTTWTTSLEPLEQRSTTSPRPHPFHDRPQCFQAKSWSFFLRPQTTLDRPCAFVDAERRVTPSVVDSRLRFPEPLDQWHPLAAGRPDQGVDRLVSRVHMEMTNHAPKQPHVHQEGHRVPSQTCWVRLCFAFTASLLTELWARPPQNTLRLVHSQDPAQAHASV